MSNTIVALIVAAGRGRRAGFSLPKQYIQMENGQSILECTMHKFLGIQSISAIQAVIHSEDLDFYSDIPLPAKKMSAPVFGGATRAESVMNGLQAIKYLNPDYVLIHDAARPYVSEDLIKDVIIALKNGSDGVFPSLELSDAIHVIDKSVVDSPDRRTFVRAQTPQGFKFEKILSAFETLGDVSGISDDVSVAVKAGLSVQSIPGEEANIKMTIPQDFSPTPYNAKNTRVGQGFDVHAFNYEDNATTVRLCGIDIPHAHSLKGHSDADVGLHALTDALLGAVCEGDIGQHFPPSDPQWKGIDSRFFLKEASDIVIRKGGSIMNVDVTLICETPKVGKYALPMREKIAECLSISINQVNVKATTTECLGFTGRKEGIAAMATASVLI